MPLDHRTVLLVEDNPRDEDLTLRAFRKSRIANPIAVARDGEEALDYLFCRGSHAGRNARDLPSIILLDLKLPKIDGLDVLRAIREAEATRLLPVVILTSSDEQEDRLRGYSLGANSYLRKPVEFQKFIEVAGQLGMYWLVLNEPPF